MSDEQEEKAVIFQDSEEDSLRAGKASTNKFCKVHGMCRHTTDGCTTLKGLRFVINYINANCNYESIHACLTSHPKTNKNLVQINFGKWIPKGKYYRVCRYTSQKKMWALELILMRMI